MMEELKFQELVLQQLGILADGQSKMQDKIAQICGDISQIRQSVEKIERDLISQASAQMDDSEKEKEKMVTQKIISSLARIETKLDVYSGKSGYFRSVK